MKEVSFPESKFIIKMGKWWMIHTTRLSKYDGELKNVSKLTSKKATDCNKWKSMVSFIKQISLFVTFTLYAQSSVFF